jgi:hypothetical protein
MERINLVNEPLFVNHSNRVFSEQNEFGMRNVEFPPIACSNLKWAESAAADSFFEFMDVHGSNLAESSAAVKLFHLSSFGGFLRFFSAGSLGFAVWTLGLFGGGGFGGRLLVARTFGALVAA